MSDVQAWIATSPSIGGALEAILDLAEADLPFVTSVVQLGMQSTGLDEFEQAMASIYRISLDAQHPFLPDLVDHVLQWAEQLREERAPEFA